MSRATDVEICFCRVIKILSLAGLLIFRGKKSKILRDFRGKFAEKSADFAGEKSKFAKKSADFAGF